MKITLIILCLILTGCGTAPKKMTANELLLLTTMMSLQTQLNIQAMEKNRLAQLRYESNLIYHGKCKNAFDSYTIIDGTNVTEGCRGENGN